MSSESIARKSVIDERRLRPGYWLSRVILLILMIASFLPFLLTIFMSFKADIQIKTDFFGMPKPLNLVNYVRGYNNILRPILNSLRIAAISVLATIIIACMSGYTFARFRFAGKSVLFALVLAVMMLPGVLLIVPQYVVTSQLHFVGSYMGLYLPYIAGQQLFGIVLLRSFFASLPEEMFEAAKIEGAGDLMQMFRIGVPLAVPTLITVGISTMIAVYNDYIWATLIITGGKKLQTFSQFVFIASNSQGFTEYGTMTAIYVIGTIPLLIITVSCLKYYLQGMLEGAVKG
jgi:ABC-type glycerol-3-phosphate transport system permease component